MLAARAVDAAHYLGLGLDPVLELVARLEPALLGAEVGGFRDLAAGVSLEVWARTPPAAGMDADRMSGLGVTGAALRVVLRRS